MAEPERFETYSEYIEYLWRTLNPKPDPRTLTRLIAAESCWLQEPDAAAATARPDLKAIDGWAKKIEATKAFGRLLSSQKLTQRVESRDTEGLMRDLQGELKVRDKNAPERSRGAEEKERRQEKQPEKKQPEKKQPEKKRPEKKQPEKKQRGRQPRKKTPGAPTL